MDMGQSPVKRAASPVISRPKMTTRMLRPATVRHRSTTICTTIGRMALVLVTAAALSACAAAEINVRGNKLDKNALAQIKPGKQTRDQVIELLGSPTSVATFDKNTIYYITQRTRLVTYHAPQVLSRTVVAINFSKDGRVDKIKTLHLKDGEKIDPVEKTTPTPGRQFTVMQQLIGNFGRFEGSEEKKAD